MISGTPLTTPLSIWFAIAFGTAARRFLVSAALAARRFLVRAALMPAARRFLFRAAARNFLVRAALTPAARDFWRKIGEMAYVDQASLLMCLKSLALPRGLRQLCNIKGLPKRGTLFRPIEPQGFFLASVPQFALRARGAHFSEKL
jgi:hypothetical protein